MNQKLKIYIYIFFASFPFPIHSQVADFIDHGVNFSNAIDCPKEEELKDKMDEAHKKYKMIVSDLKAGLFCSKCHQSKTELESSGNESFEAHLGRVEGHAYSATQEMYDKAYSSFKREWENLDNQRESAWQSCKDQEKKKREAEFNRQQAEFERQQVELEKSQKEAENERIKAENEKARLEEQRKREAEEKARLEEKRKREAEEKARLEEQQKREAERIEAERKEEEKRQDIKEKMQDLDERRQANEENTVKNLKDIKKEGGQIKKSFDSIKSKEKEFENISGYKVNKGNTSKIIDSVPEDDDFISNAQAIPCYKLIQYRDVELLNIYDAEIKKYTLLADYRLAISSELFELNKLKNEADWGVILLTLKAIGDQVNGALKLIKAFGEIPKGAASYFKVQDAIKKGKNTLEYAAAANANDVIWIYIKKEVIEAIPVLGNTYKIVNNGLLFNEYLDSKNSINEQISKALEELNRVEKKLNSPEIRIKAINDYQNYITSYLNQYCN